MSKWSKVLYRLAVLDCDIMPGSEVTTSATLAKICKLSRKDTLKELRELKAKGWVATAYESYYDERRERWCILRGWRTTRKARETPEYKKAYDRERLICRQCFDIDIGELKIEES